MVLRPDGKKMVARFQLFREIQHGRLVPVVVFADRLSVEVNRRLVVARDREPSLVGRVPEAKRFAEEANIFFGSFGAGPNPILSCRGAASETSRVGRRVVRPAALTRMSTLPNFSIAASETAWMDFSSETSTVIASERRPRASISFAASWASLALLPVGTTSAPASANPSAIALPMPEVAPITTAVRFVSSRPKNAMIAKNVIDRRQTHQPLGIGPKLVSGQVRA